MMKRRFVLLAALFAVWPASGRTQTASGLSNVVELSSTVATVIGGQNLNRRQLIVWSNDSTQTVYVYWGTSGSVPTAATVVAKGIALTAGGGTVSFNVTLHPNGSGGTDPTLYGVAGTGNEMTPNDVRWTETS